jgi:clan AA aspartic protease
MTGSVIDGKARIDVSFVRDAAPSLTIEFVIDTGFEGALAMSSASVLDLGLPFCQTITARLADHSECAVDAHSARVYWNDSLIEVAVLAMGEGALLGTALLEGNDVHIRFDEGGSVVIEPVEVD